MPVEKKHLSKTDSGKKLQEQKTYCCRCGRAYGRRQGNFPVSHSPLYRASGYLPFCSECVEKMYEEYTQALGSPREAMRRLCMKMDLYWSPDLYDMAEKASGTASRVRTYIGKTNIIRYIDKSFDDTLEEEAALMEQSAPGAAFACPDGSEPETEEPTDPAIVEFWGAGFNHDFYMELERRYKEWTQDKKDLRPEERTLYRQICLQESIISRDAAMGRQTERNVNALNNLIGSMNLRPAQKKETADAELEKMPLGVGIQKWEFTRPLPETEQKKRDVRGVVKNITTWYLGHACKMVGLKNSYCRQYEEAMERLRVKRPEFDEEDDDSVLSDIFGSASAEGHEADGGDSS